MQPLGIQCRKLRNKKLKIQSYDLPEGIPLIMLLYCDNQASHRRSSNPMVAFPNLEFSSHFCEISATSQKTKVIQ
ncbi:hypothetical protein HNY73_016378 [Argiope bruennichi]|uniref:Uncharacterized protein n=1 Tax=Argiope bruennichi TaxID=94029 RepID=A0A8T0EM32_ARGBR|nr:hypothetical protein HNY73_016378 [Argiope bruennichi]